MLCNKGEETNNNAIPIVQCFLQKLNHVGGGGGRGRYNSIKLGEF
jgi:hypothetical protein